MGSHKMPKSFKRLTSHGDKTSSTRSTKKFKKTSTLGAWYGPTRKTHQEKKFVDTPFQLILSTTMALSLCNAPVAGNLLYQRIGNSITMKSLYIRGLIEPTLAAAAANHDLLRIIVVFDRQPNTNPFNLNDLLLNINNLGVTSSDALAHINPEQTERFFILRDQRIVVGGSTAAGNTPAGLLQFVDPNNGLDVNMFIPLKNLETRFNLGGAGTVGDINTGALYIMTIAQNNAVAVAPFTFKGTARLRYTD